MGRFFLSGFLVGKVALREIDLGTGNRWIPKHAGEAGLSVVFENGLLEALPGDPTGLTPGLPVDVIPLGNRR